MSSMPECKICGDFVSYGPVICNDCNDMNEVITAAEAEKLWQLKPGTVRRACREKRIQARLSAGTWLTTKEAMVKVYGIRASK